MLLTPRHAFAALALSAAVLATGCGEPAQKVGEEIRSYTLLGQTTPKHYYVTLRDNTTQQVYNRVYVSKHCNAFRQNKPGDVHLLKRVTYADKNGQFTGFEGLYAAFCTPRPRPPGG